MMIGIQQGYMAQQDHTEAAADTDPETTDAMAALRRLFDGPDEEVTARVAGAGFTVKTDMLTKDYRIALSRLGFAVGSIHHHTELVHDSDGEPEVEGYLRVNVTDKEVGR